MPKQYVVLCRPKQPSVRKEFIWRGSYSEAGAAKTVKRLQETGFEVCVYYGWRQQIKNKYNASDENILWV